MLTLLLNIVYCGLVTLVAPLILWKRVRTGKYKRGWGQKFRGTLPIRTDASTPRVWLHAVSVGEVLQLQQVVAALRQSQPSVQIMVTTTTETGHAVANEKLRGCEVAFFPLDFSWSVNEALRRVQPDLIVLVELELWPNFILTAKRLGIPLMLINGRLSARSFRGYARIRPLVQRLLQSFSMIAVQAEEYRERFLALGADPATTLVTGSIKFDGVVTDRQNLRTQGLREWLSLQSGELAFVAGSTQEPEEELALGVYETLSAEFPQLRLVLVPRHPERGNSVAALLESRGHALVRRSRSDSLCSPRAVGLLDTVGELGACWGLADVAFVGGSFTSRGGQNMLEPAAFGAAVCYGPNTWNFRQVVELLEQRDATTTVRSAEELTAFVRTMLTDRSQASERGARARKLVLSQQGATAKTVELIVQCLNGAKAVSPDRAVA
ncbi:3-deoxy-D-manno-octulosonic-acid transferase [Planctomicrobium piriforme]|uniref:3-deoxy-D-manno-octulosonic acid transferase n=1 Tax=Planctomicrobium piriforme TaxID=1576369 RepID=A0A1I3K1F1_9PLAN|nr:3-deoxy-D-manno-octulosonic-acid transferase [Planctomicrobium piriforme]